MAKAQGRNNLTSAMLRGARCRCPRCGVGKLFHGWYTLHESCSSCGDEWPYDRRGDTWAFMYVTTAMITGFFIVALFFVRPAQTRVGQLVVLALALLVIVGSLPFRKGVAIAIERHFQMKQRGDS